MKIAWLILCIPLLLALIPSKKLNISKDILGSWVMIWRLDVEKKHLPPSYCKTKDTESAAYEFKKKGEVIRYDTFGFSGNRSEAKAYKGTWNVMSDSTLHLTLQIDDEKIHRICWLFRNKNQKLEMILFHADK